MAFSWLVALAAAMDAPGPRMMPREGAAAGAAIGFADAADAAIDAAGPREMLPPPPMGALGALDTVGDVFAADMPAAPLRAVFALLAGAEAFGADALEDELADMPEAPLREAVLPPVPEPILPVDDVGLLLAMFDEVLEIEAVALPIAKDGTPLGPLDTVPSVRTRSISISASLR